MVKAVCVPAGTFTTIVEVLFADDDEVSVAVLLIEALSAGALFIGDDVGLVVDTVGSVVVLDLSVALYAGLQEAIATITDAIKKILSFINESL